MIDATGCSFLERVRGAAALIAIVTLLDIYTLDFFALFTAALALTIGMITLTGSMVAAGKLHKYTAKPLFGNIIKNHIVSTQS